MTHPTLTTFRADSLASRVIAFFSSNPEEELKVEDITDKFDATRGNVHTLLSKAVELQIISRTQNADGEYIYKSGPRLPVDNAAPNDAVSTTHHPIANAKATTRKAKLGPQAPRATLNFDALKVEDNIPFTSGVDKGQFKWQPLFDKLTKAGQSIAIPGEVRGAVGAAATKLNKEKTRGTYRVAKTGETTARVWRVA